MKYQGTEKIFRCGAWVKVVYANDHSAFPFNCKRWDCPNCKKKMIKEALARIDKTFAATVHVAEIDRRGKNFSQWKRNHISGRTLAVKNQKQGFFVLSSRKFPQSKCWCTNRAKQRVAALLQNVQSGRAIFWSRTNKTKKIAANNGPVLCLMSDKFRMPLKITPWRLFWYLRPFWKREGDKVAKFYKAGEAFMEQRDSSLVFAVMLQVAMRKRQMENIWKYMENIRF